MDASHAAKFSEWFDVLAVTHSKPFPGEEIRNRAKAEYFDVLRPYPIEAVSYAYESLRRKMKKWPVPADWLENLPPFGSAARLPPLTDAETAQNDDAERLGYEAAAVCECAFCVQAGCFMPPRYVPRLDAQGQVIERRHPKSDGRAVLLGRWIHGYELKSWYAARAQYYSLKTLLDEQTQAQRSVSSQPEDRIRRLEQRAKVLTVG